MNKLLMRSLDLINNNIEKIGNIFPGCIVESRSDDGTVRRSIDFELLQQELSLALVESSKERYQINWPGKKESLLTANTPITSTLRPCRDESSHFDTSKNLYIEGDNLEVLKLLQETYLSKVKLIYIDPPYNTGNDFIYKDNFAIGTEEYLLQTNQKDSQGSRLVMNTIANGRFHSDWLSMMYPRLRLARTLLSDDGVIFVSIDTNEVANLRLLMDEIFGASCYKNTISVRRGIKNVQAQFEDVSALSLGHEYILMYSKNSDTRLPKLIWSHETPKPGKWDTFWRGTDRPTMRYELFGIKPQAGQWRWEKNRAQDAANNYNEYLVNHSNEMTLDEWFLDNLTATNLKLNFVRKNEEGVVQYYVPPSEGKLLSDNWMDITLSGNESEFDTEKSVELLDRIISWLCPPKQESLVMDFFSGSATTGHAVMLRNRIDGGNRKFILVQSSDACNENSLAYKAGHKTICDIGKSRLRKLGASLRAEATGSLNFDELDIGFRVLKIDSSNMKDVYYAPDEVQQGDLLGQVSNIREDRTPEDLLFQVLLDWGVDLALPITQETIAGKAVFFVDGNALAACFDSGINEAFVKELATRKPLRAVFRDAGFSSDSVKINVEQIFKLVSPGTEVKSI